MAKTCIHFDPVKSASEIHNWRMKELDYVIKELTPNNEHWVDPRYEGKTIADIRKNAIKPPSDRRCRQKRFLSVRQ